MFGWQGKIVTRNFLKTLMLPKEANCSQMPKQHQRTRQVVHKCVCPLVFKLLLSVSFWAQVLSRASGRYLRKQKHSTFQERSNLVTGLFSLTLRLNQSIFKTWYSNIVHISSEKQYSSKKDIDRGVRNSCLLLIFIISVTLENILDLSTTPLLYLYSVDRVLMHITDICRSYFLKCHTNAHFHTCPHPIQQAVQ